jgi:hypothetical protein
LVAFGCAWALQAAAAEPPKAADTDPPVIQHVPLPTIHAGDVTIDFTVSDQSALFSVILHWRLVGDREYTEVGFAAKENTFHVDLKDVTKDLEFWIEAYDEFGNGPALDGTADRPNRSRLLSEPVPTQTPANVPPPTPVPNVVNTPTPAATPTPVVPAAPKVDGPLVSDHVGHVGAARNLLAGRLEPKWMAASSGGRTSSTRTLR